MSDIMENLPPHFLDKTYGAELLACFAATALWGVQCLQTFMYYQTYPKDHWAIKLVVGWTWIMDTVHQGLIVAYVYESLITGFGDPSPIFGINKEVTLSVLFTIFVSVPTQLFFVYRIFVLGGRNWILPIFTSACIVSEIVTTVVFYCLVTAPNVQVVDAESGSTRAICLTSYVLAAVIDVTIALSMVYLLRKTKVEGLSQTQRMVARLTIYSVHTGVWTALLAIFVAVTLFAYPDTFIFIGLYFPISALYCNTLLANLNVRQHIRQGMKDVITLSAVGYRPGLGAPSGEAGHFDRGRLEANHLAVRVTNITATDSDFTAVDDQSTGQKKSAPRL